MGCDSSWAFPAKKTKETRSRGGSVRRVHCRSGDSNSSSCLSLEKSSVFFRVHGDLPYVTVSHAELKRPNHMLRLKAGLKLRTLRSSRPPSEDRHFTSIPPLTSLSHLFSLSTVPQRS